MLAPEVANHASVGGGDGARHPVNPLEVTLKLTVLTPEVAHSAFSAEALLGEGINFGKSGCGAVTARFLWTSHQTPQPEHQGGQPAQQVL